MGTAARRLRLLLGTALGLRVTAPPTKVLATGDAVWLEIDPAQAALIPRSRDA